MSRLRIAHLHARGVEAERLDVADGACAAIHGPSGSGKTQLLRAIADLDPTDGEIWLDGQARSAFGAAAWRRQVTYLSADSHWWAPQVRAHAKDWRDDDLTALGFAPDVLDWEIQRLSSGERQRLALARALAHRPSALLLDEPSANLDAVNTERVEQLIANWRANSAGCALWVSHDPAQRARTASAQYRIDDGVLHHGDNE